MSTQIARLAFTKTALDPVAADDARYRRELWFTSDPVDKDFCSRVIELQLNTFSCDQGWVSEPEKGSWSWFEIAIFPDANTREVKTDRYGNELRWRSHCNIMTIDKDEGSASGSEESEDECDDECQADTEPSAPKPSTHFGNVFDRRDSVLLDLEEGNVLAVYACARFGGWVNHAVEGELIARVLKDDPPTLSWSLKTAVSTSDTPHIRGDQGIFTLVPPDALQVVATGPEIESRFWFMSPVLSERVATHVEDIQLFTTGHNQGYCENEADGMWTWFDLMILDSPKSREPKLGDDGRALVWKSHDIHINDTDDSEVAGPILDRSHPLVQSLKVGDVLAVRVCARFPGWTSYATDARLIVRISAEVSDVAPIPEPNVVDWKTVVEQKNNLVQATDAYLANLGVSSGVLNNLRRTDIRRDNLYGADGTPLRLLSLDGGGVRGISSLYILQGIMEQITGDKDAKPCEYFDMIAGTSTGGLLAIMLGRLEMSISECITHYNALSEAIFPAPKKTEEAKKGLVSNIWGYAKKTAHKASMVGDFMATGAIYDANNLIHAIEGILKGMSLSERETMRPSDGERDCKVFVVACHGDDLSREAVHIRTYHNERLPDKPEYVKSTIIEAARATSAAPAYFSREKIGEDILVDGGLGYNNPVFLLIGEAKEYFGYARPVECLVSIGTGLKPHVVLPEEGSGFSGIYANATAAASGYKSALADLTTNSEGAAAAASHLFPPGVYYRFNVGKLKSDGKDYEKPIDLADWQGMKGLVDETLDYLKLPAEIERLVACGKKLPPKHGERANQG